MPEDTGQQYRMPYIESSVFIAQIKGEVVGNVDRGSISNHVLEVAERGAYKVYTAALTLAEVYKTRGSTVLDSTSTETFLSYCENEWVEIIDVTRLIAEEANRLCRRLNIRKPNDAIHLACTLYAGCDVLLTWDHVDLLKLVLPDIRIEEPKLFGQASMFGEDPNRPR